VARPQAWEGGGHRGRATLVMAEDGRAGAVVDRAVLVRWGQWVGLYHQHAEGRYLDLKV
jgi:hypothetical protein